MSDETIVHAEGFCRAGCEHDEPAAAQVVLCRLWLRRHAERRATIDRTRTSYGWKHDVERTIGDYISNGAFIRAALLEGYRVAPVGPRSPNAYLDIRPRSAPTSIAAEMLR